MNRKRIAARVAVAVLGASLLALGACHDGGDSKTSFNSFVLNLVDDTSDTTDPEPVGGLDFKFSEDEHAFDSLFEQ